MTNYKVVVNTSDFHSSNTVPVLPDLREDTSSCQHKQNKDVFTTQKKLNSVINKLILVAWRKMSGSYKSSYTICALVCLLEYGCLFFQGIFPMCCLSRWVKHVIRKCSCLHLGMNGANYSKQMSWAFPWWRWALAPVLRVHCELQPLKEELELNDERLVGILQQTVLRHHHLYSWKAAACWFLACSTLVAGNFVLGFLFLFLLPVQQVKGFFCGLPSRRHAFKLKLSKSS